MAQSKINHRLKKEIDELNLLATNNDKPVIFILDKESFDEEEMNDLTEPKERVITGRVLPNAEIFKEGAFQIEIKLPTMYPFNPPTVYFLTPIYHPNVGTDGKFRHDLITKTACWTHSTSLMDIIKVIVKRIDEPDVEYSSNHEVAKEYTENRDEFNRKALEAVRKYAMPRS